MLLACFVNICIVCGVMTVSVHRSIQVLQALAEIAFNPEFLVNRIEKERRAVLAEAQMMNTIEYRVDCQLLQYLHEENALGYRFPIGKTDQVPGPSLKTLIMFLASKGAWCTLPPL